MFVGGFKYWLAFTKDGKKFYRCRRFRKGCPGKLCVTGDLPVPAPNPAHNHRPETDRGLVDSFRKVLTRRAATEKLDLHKIFLDEAATRHSEAALLYPFTTAESAMAKARRKFTRNHLPATISEFPEVANLLRTTGNFSIVYCGQRDPFFSEICTRNHPNGTTASALIFAHLPTVLRYTQNGLNEVQVNLLEIPKQNIQLLTLHYLDKTAKITPIAYVLLRGNVKSLDIFTDIFAHFREKLQILPAVVISDSLDDAPIYSALQLTFPEASIKANWFEYVESVKKELRGKTSPEVVKDIFNEATNKTILRMILVLPFLPADYMAPGLESIRKWTRDKGILLDKESVIVGLCKFVETIWLRGVGAGKLSLFRVTISVEDHLKEFHKMVLSAVDGNSIEKDNNLTVWNVIDALTVIAAKVNGKTNAGEGTSKGEEKKIGKLSTTRNQLLSEAIIRNATEQWITQPIHLRSPLQFLQMASHFITPQFLAEVLRVKYEREEVVDKVVTGTQKEGKVIIKEVIRLEKLDTQLTASANNKVAEFVQATPTTSNNLVQRLEPPPLAFIPQVMEKAREQIKLIRKRKAGEPPPLRPIERIIPK